MKPDVGGSDVAHRGSHRDLLRPAAPECRPGPIPDAIVIPAARPAGFLLPAMRLAAGMDTLAVVLCSGAATRREVVGLTREVPGLRSAVVPVPGAYANLLLDFRTSSVRPAQVGRLGDLSLKRNLGLLLGHLAGWRSLLFLDDDMRELDPDTVRRAGMALAPGGAVGMPAVRFPDNSVVCHARREVGLPQDVFVSGSALLVDCHDLQSFFPRVYNEDWLFLADALRRGAVAAVGESRQLDYDPFASPARAAAEEFGDVLAEGLFGLVHAERPFAEATAGHWSDVLVRRKELIMEVWGGTSRLEPTLAGKVQDSLAAAEQRRSTIEGYDLASYVRKWRDDLDTWRSRLRRLRRGMPLPAALGRLGLREHAVLSEAPRGAGPAATRPAVERGGRGPVPAPGAVSAAPAG